VDLRAALGQMSVEWLRAAEGTLTHADPVPGGSQRTLRTPFDGDAVLHLWKEELAQPGSGTPPLKERKQP